MWPAIGIANSAKPRSCGIGPAARQSIPGHRLAGPPNGGHSAKNSRAEGLEDESGRKPACSSILTFRPPRSPGYSTTCRARGSGPSAGELRGTVDSFLLWRLTGGEVHVTDITNASRTPLYDIHAQRWDAELPLLFRVPEASFPKFAKQRHLRSDRAGLFDSPTPDRRHGRRPAGGPVGQACFAPGMTRPPTGPGVSSCSTAAAKRSDRQSPADHPGLSSAARRLTRSKARSSSPAPSIKWLRDGLGVIASVGHRQHGDAPGGQPRGLLVPAFAALARRYWDPDARGDPRADARCDRRAPRPRRAGSRRLSDARPGRCHDRRRQRRA